MNASVVFGSATVATALREHPFATGFDFADVKPIHKAFPGVVNDLRYDVAELALVTFLQAYDAGRPLCLLPVTVLGRFQHHTLVTLDGAGVSTVDDLAGRRVGVRSWSQTTGVWVRGILADDHRLDPARVKWMVYESGHVAGAADPDFVTRAPAGATLPQDFLTGQIDAAIMGNELPGDERVRTIIPDPARAAAGWYGRVGAVPLNHMAVVTDAFAAANGDLVAEICRVIAGAAPAMPRVSSSPDLYPAGFDAVAASLDLAGRYAYEQGITSRPVTADEVQSKLEGLTGHDFGRVKSA
ncbi:hypothetical protein RB614_08830 [Phytohabitans sp. ZYX-F-186]|uniref:4,5-dihydroxyphthalate decarboxylase n=1 Tax=Phytohabitans maris TaxID=3071409 RepID=A0ABU0ZE81_9ACTN|nr:hypothetical protein [Phytohabitans sp. ZYX-F-186]MDQ7904625.1 hypothetical protein [Phytohabitans sp. ZYX-F-186]